MSTTIAELAAQDCPWLMSPGEHRGVVVSSRIRLARTWAPYSFHRKLSRKRQQELTERLLGHLSDIGHGTAWQMQSLSDIERLALVERQVISREMAAAKRPGGVWLDDHAVPMIAAMVNEEDHLRLQLIGAGLCLPMLLERAINFDQALEKRVAWAADAQLGYLTACHTNLGTGLRASVMLHLPALSETGELKAVLRALGRLHLAVRGGHGEGTEPTGHTYQVSNARSLGHTEAAYVSAINEAVERVIAAEHLARAGLLEKARTRLEDKVFRAWGLLTQARSLTTEELSENLSWVRLGTALDVLSDSDWAIPTRHRDRRWRILDRLAVQCQPAHIQLLHQPDPLHPGGVESDAADRDRLRASHVRVLLTSEG